MEGEVHVLKKRKGSTMAMTVMICFLLAIFGGIVSKYTVTNMMTARLQRQRIQAYYLVTAGLELGTEAVLQTQGGVPHKLLSEYANTPTKEALNFTVDAQDLLDSSMDWPYQGEIVLSIRATDKKGTPATNSTKEVWIEIGCNGRVSTDDGATDSTYRGTLRILTTNPSMTIREVTSPI